MLLSSKAKAFVLLRAKTMISLSQNGRADLQFMGDLQYFSSTVLRQQAENGFYRSGNMGARRNALLGDMPPSELDAFVEKTTYTAD